jgi:hypothetical protein
MKCYCYETDLKFVFCAEKVEPEYEKNLLQAWFHKSDTLFIKEYPKDLENANEDKKNLSANFRKLAPTMFEGIFDWQISLLNISEKFLKHNIEWYVIGSVSKIIRGVKIEPHDIDIIVHTKDFYKVKNIFKDNIIEPFVDNKNNWVVRYFGRLCVNGAMVDIASDIKMNSENKHYDKISWKDYQILI